VSRAAPLPCLMPSFCAVSRTPHMLSWLPIAAYAVLRDCLVAWSAVIDGLPLPSPAFLGFHAPPMLGHPLYFHELAGYSRRVAFTTVPRPLPSSSHSVSTMGFHVDPTWKPFAPLWARSTL